LAPNDGPKFYNYAHGIDKRELELPGSRQRTSVSVDVNYGIRLSNATETEEVVRGIAGEVCKKLIDLSLRTKKLTLKIMVRAKGEQESWKYLGHGKCDEVSYHAEFQRHVDEPEEVGDLAWKLCQESGIPWEELRGLGLMLTKSRFSKHCI
jgi:DNA repair protein REV1